VVDETTTVHLVQCDVFRAIEFLEEESFQDIKSYQEEGEQNDGDYETRIRRKNGDGSEGELSNVVINWWLEMHNEKKERKKTDVREAGRGRKCVDLFPDA
jgi:hypothetical protein